MKSLNQLLFEVHISLLEGGFDHAFGGALALMQYAAEPRMTRDIDVNVFASEADADLILQSFAHLAEVKKNHIDELISRGFTRVMAGPYPIDVFISVHEFHEDMRSRVVMFPHGDSQLPFISATHLTVLKALFDRPKDWVDIMEMMKAGVIDVPHALGWLASMTSERDERTARLRAFSTVKPSEERSPEEILGFTSLLGERK
jgi:hypothetical protein